MSKIIKCKVCSEDIAANAKICPKCGAKNKKPFYKKWWVWTIVVILIIAVGSGGGSDKNTDPKESGAVAETKSGETTATEKEAAHNIGEIITTNKFEINVTSVETARSVGSTYFKEEASEGGIYVVVNWEYKNISDSPVTSFSFPSIKLTDTSGTKYDADINATANYAMETNLDRKVLSDLNPNIKVKDAQVFEISEEMYNVGGFSVVVDADKDFSVKIN